MTLTHLPCRSSPPPGLDLAAMRRAALRLAALGHKRGDAAAVLRGMIGRAAGRRGAARPCSCSRRGGDAVSAPCSGRTEAVRIARDLAIAAACPPVLKKRGLIWCSSGRSTRVVALWQATGGTINRLDRRLPYYGSPAT